MNKSPVFAGSFYPAIADELTNLLNSYKQNINMSEVLTDTTEIVVHSASEWYDVSEEGIIQIEVLLVFNSTISHYDIGAGTVICDMVYQPDKDAFVLAPDTMRIEWNQ